MRIALSMICKGTQKEAERLAECLKYASPHVDNIFITITGGDDKKPVEDVCALFDAEISYFNWVHDFAKARNYNFSQVPKDYDYILWLDADDALRGGEKLRETIENNPETDVFSFNYLYAFDEQKNPIVVHKKSRVVKNDGCVEWAGSLHEDFKANRELKIEFVKDIEVIHLSNDDRFEEAKKRNLEVARKQKENEPDDPRSHWNLGNSLKAMGKNNQAVTVFKKFIELSDSDDEKYIARLRMSESYWGMGNLHKAVETAQYALGLKPEFPDAYHLLGALYLEMNKAEKAVQMFTSGLVKKPPYLKTIVYNPRDYDYVPMMNLAKAYFALSLPGMAIPLMEACHKIIPSDDLAGKIKLMKKEEKRFEKVTKEVNRLSKIKDDKELEKEIEKIDDDMKAHPAVCNLKNTRIIKQKSSGKDLVFFCGYTEREWTPEVAEKEGVGGSEEAIIWLARGLADKGWNVTVYNNCGYKAEKFGNVTYKPFWSWNYRDKQDVVVLWRSPKALDYDINCDKVYLDLHDVIDPGELTEKRMEKCSGIFVKSKFHRELFPNISNNKFIIIPNGIDAEEFRGEHKKEKGLMINTSSPDRSMRAVADLYPLIKEATGAKMKWAYGWRIWEYVHGGNSKQMAWKKRLQEDIKKSGIEELGMVSHKEVAEMYKKAEILFYPSEFAEIDCISLSKAMASGCIPVTTDFAAMGEKKKKPGVFAKSAKNKETWCRPYQSDFSAEGIDVLTTIKEGTIDLLNNRPEKKDIDEMREWALKTFDWKNIINQWNKKI